MYWSAMWNLLDRYFLIRTVPNPVANAALRVAVGVGILMFPDNDIKELGDKWEGLDAERDGNDVSGTESAAVDTGVTSNGPDSVLSHAEMRALVRHAVCAGIFGLEWAGSEREISRDELARRFCAADVNKDGALSATELASIFRGRFKNEDENEDEDAAGDSTEEALDRFALVEAWLGAHGLSLDLHNNYFQNIFLGTGIITIWSGLEKFFNATFLKRTVPHVGLNNFLRIAVAAGILYFPTGTINDMGDGYLEDDEDEEMAGDEREATRQPTRRQASYFSTLLATELARRERESSTDVGEGSHVRPMSLGARSLENAARGPFAVAGIKGRRSRVQTEADNVRVTLEDALSVFDRADTEGRGSVTKRALVETIIASRTKL
jgi:hypothetical protein